MFKFSFFMSVKKVSQGLGLQSTVILDGKALGIKVFSFCGTQYALNISLPESPCEISSVLPLEAMTVQLASADLLRINVQFPADSLKYGKKNLQDTMPAFGNFQALQIPAMEYTWSRGGVLTYLRAQHHTDGESILSPSLGDSWTTSFMLGPLLLLVRVCAGVSPSSLDMCSTQLLHLPLK